MIIEDYVSFEVAKLLKEKGFDCLCHSYFRKNNPNNLVKETCGANWNDTPFFTSRPTLQMVMKWLREVHDLIIYPRLVISSDFKHEAWVYSIYNKFSGESDKGTNLYTGYEEAVEVAIKYCLEHLI